ncbi:Protein CBG13832 [Caenorhabditis briggsae]|uniref:Protein CBG13832 n=2 Tax=Caenorhabditis briggsae TaxID=6238 RepID=A8XIT2_CAEBR|nr:Protein CBG13832 [Caenorhabditis briggsae]CAP32557.2 Protein CBG13832 [Caenorhabditis briggsae]
MDSGWVGDVCDMGFQMRWLLLALLILPSLSNSGRYEELKPVTIFHAGHPLERMVTTIGCRKEIHLPDIHDVIAPIREALLTKQYILTEMMRDAKKPRDENAEVQMVVLKDDHQKSMGLTTFWVRKTFFRLPDRERSVIRVFINELEDSELNEYCRNKSYPFIRLATSIAINEFFFTPVLICDYGVPACLALGRGTEYVYAGVFFFFSFFATMCCDSCYRKCNSDDDYSDYDQSGFPTNASLPPEFQLHSSRERKNWHWYEEGHEQQYPYGTGRWGGPRINPFEEPIMC